MSVRLRCASSVYTDGREKPILFLVWTFKTELLVEGYTILCSHSLL